MSAKKPKKRLLLLLLLLLLAIPPNRSPGLNVLPLLLQSQLRLPLPRPLRHNQSFSATRVLRFMRFAKTSR
jgi:hypothetical protein